MGVMVVLLVGGAEWFWFSRCRPYCARRPAGQAALVLMPLPCLRFSLPASGGSAGQRVLRTRRVRRTRGRRGRGLPPTRLRAFSGPVETLSPAVAARFPSVGFGRRCC